MDFWVELNTVLAPFGNLIMILFGPALWSIFKEQLNIKNRVAHIETVQKLRAEYREARARVSQE